MKQGKIVELSPTEDLFSKPQNDYTKELLNSIPIEHPRQRKATRPSPLEEAHLHG